MLQSTNLHFKNRKKPKNREKTQKIQKKNRKNEGGRLSTEGVFTPKISLLRNQTFYDANHMISRLGMTPTSQREHAWNACERTNDSVARLAVCLVLPRRFSIVNEKGNVIIVVILVVVVPITHYRFSSLLLLQYYFGMIEISIITRRYSVGLVCVIKKKLITQQLIRSYYLLIKD